jgi:hypothetical protein
MNSQQQGQEAQAFFFAEDEGSIYDCPVPNVTLQQAENVVSDARANAKAALETAKKTAEDRAPPCLGLLTTKSF